MRSARRRGRRRIANALAFDARAALLGKDITRIDRPPDRRVRDESILPPEILLLGASPSQEVKCFALGQEERSSPHSAISFKER